MAEPQKDFDKLRAEQEKDDADILDELEKESKAFDKVGRPHYLLSHAVASFISSKLTFVRTQKSNVSSAPSAQTLTTCSIYNLVSPTKTSGRPTAKSLS